jgi:hypothetical protein
MAGSCENRVTRTGQLGELSELVRCSLQSLRYARDQMSRVSVIIDELMLQSNMEACEHRTRDISLVHGSSHGARVGSGDDTFDIVDGWVCFSVADTRDYIYREGWFEKVYVQQRRFMEVRSDGEVLCMLCYRYMLGRGFVASYNHLESGRHRKKVDRWLLQNHMVEYLSSSISSPSHSTLDVTNISLVGDLSQLGPGFGGYWCAYVDAKPHGTYLGKATDTECWYGSRGWEYHQKAGFRRVRVQVVLSADRGPPVLTQDGYGSLWFALAQTEHGQIPAKASETKCWYTFAGEEYETTVDFQFAISLQ